jgi:hypothetical protein
VLQVKAEHDLCWQSQQSKIQESLRQLKLYNNQARDKSKVGDPLLFTVFQTNFSALYSDILTAVFEGNEEGDADQAENFTDLAEHDYRVMQKDEIDHDWIWDACFCGRGLLLLHEFDRSKDIMAPVPEVMDPMTFPARPERHVSERRQRPRANG